VKSIKMIQLVLIAFGLLLAWPAASLYLSGDNATVPQACIAQANESCSICCNDTSDCKSDPNIGCNMGYTCNKPLCAAEYPRVCTQR
jgi:hypothetical protein